MSVGGIVLALLAVTASPAEAVWARLRGTPIESAPAALRAAPLSLRLADAKPPVVALAMVTLAILAVITLWLWRLWKFMAPKLRRGAQAPAGAHGHPKTQVYCAEYCPEFRGWQTWFDILPKTDAPFLLANDGRPPLTYRTLREFIRSEAQAMAPYGVRNQDRVCTMIPNGPNAAVMLLALGVRCVYAPLNPKLTDEETEFEFDDLPCHTLIVEQGSALAGPIALAIRKGIQILEMRSLPEATGLYSLSRHPRSPGVRAAIGGDPWSSRDDLALVVHTSGTTNKPKIVPLTMENLTVGALCIRSTLLLNPGDVGWNIMPLFHMHGIGVNILCTALSGATVWCTKGFENPRTAWEDLMQMKPKWYSAVPTMHMLLLEIAEEEDRAGSPVPSGLQLIRNCSAALVPSVSSRMETAYSCTVMPTYAMSESLPICSNPRFGHLTLRSVGPPAGPNVRLLDEGEREVAPGSEGEICVKGLCVTSGYEIRDHMPKDPNIEAFTKRDRMLRTGDKGFFDANGYINLTGRFKEIISCGGEKISPFEVEDVFKQHPAVRDCIAYSHPHEQLGEVVGLAVVPQSAKGVTLGELTGHKLAAKVSQKWWPKSLVLFKDGIPKGATGKPMRIGLAKKLEMPALSASDPSIVAEWDYRSGVLVPLQAGASGEKSEHPQVAAAIQGWETSIQRKVPQAGAQVVDSLGGAMTVSAEFSEDRAVMQALVGFGVLGMIWAHFFMPAKFFAQIDWDDSSDYVKLPPPVSMAARWAISAVLAPPCNHIFIVSLAHMDSMRENRVGRIECGALGLWLLGLHFKYVAVPLGWVVFGEEFRTIKDPEDLYWFFAWYVVCRCIYVGVRSTGLNEYMHLTLMYVMYKAFVGNQPGPGGSSEGFLGFKCDAHAHHLVAPLLKLSLLKVQAVYILLYTAARVFVPKLLALRPLLQRSIPWRSVRLGLCVASIPTYFIVCYFSFALNLAYDNPIARPEVCPNLPFLGGSCAEAYKGDLQFMNQWAFYPGVKLLLSIPFDAVLYAVWSLKVALLFAAMSLPGIGLWTFMGWALPGTYLVHNCIGFTWWYRPLHICGFWVAPRFYDIVEWLPGDLARAGGLIAFAFLVALVPGPLFWRFVMDLAHLLSLASGRTAAAYRALTKN